MLPVFSVSGQYLAVFGPPNLITLVRTQGTDNIYHSDITVPIPVESVVVAIAVHEETIAETIAVISAREAVGFSTGNRLISRKLRDRSLLSLCFAVPLNKENGNVQSDFSSDGRSLFVARSIPVENQIEVSSYNIDTREKTMTVKLDTKAITEWCMFGPILCGENNCVALQLSSEHKKRSTIGFRKGTKGQASIKKLIIISDSGISRIALEKTCESLHLSISEGRRLLYLDPNQESASAFTLKEWTAAANTFHSLGEIRGHGMRNPIEYVGFARVGNHVTLVSNNAQFEVREMSEVV